VKSTEQGFAVPYGTTIATVGTVRGTIGRAVMRVERNRGHVTLSGGAPGMAPCATGTADQRLRVGRNPDGGGTAGAPAPLAVPHHAPFRCHAVPSHFSRNRKGPHPFPAHSETETALHRGPAWLCVRAGRLGSPCVRSVEATPPAGLEPAESPAKAQNPRAEQGAGSIPAVSTKPVICRRNMELTGGTIADTVPTAPR
jgi:hypothetical protein